MPVIVVLTGAGISAESGIPTFRDANGLWEGHDVQEVASPGGFAKNPQLVLDFYNMRRKAAYDAQPNAGHLALKILEEHALVVVITQNVDSLHERSGSTHVLHLHGELCKVRSTGNPKLIYDYQYRAIMLGDLCEQGHQLRPHIVWFGEEVPLIPLAAGICEHADALMVIGTSLQVYPAAGLIDFVTDEAYKYVIDRDLPQVRGSNKNLKRIEKPASLGVPEAVQDLISHFN